MTEAEAQRWIASRYPAHADRIAAFLAMVRSENDRQNLIAPSTLSHTAVRHAVDSLQLADYAAGSGQWVDIGTGGGFPGLMIAIVRAAPMMLIEPRRKRAEFLRISTSALQLDHVEVIQTRAQSVNARAEVISARAVAGLDALVQLGKSWSSSTTRWILPRGRLSENDMTAARAHFRTSFHVERSITSGGSAILVAQGIPQ